MTEICHLAQLLTCTITSLVSFLPRASVSSSAGMSTLLPAQGWHWKSDETPDVKRHPEAREPSLHPACVSLLLGSTSPNLYSRNCPAATLFPKVAGGSVSPKSPDLELRLDLPLPRQWKKRIKAPDLASPSLQDLRMPMSRPAGGQEGWTAYFHDCLTALDCLLMRGEEVVGSWAIQSHGVNCPNASQSRLPELALERPWPHLARTLYLCPRTQNEPCLGPCSTDSTCSWLPRSSASGKADFVHSKD